MDTWKVCFEPYTNYEVNQNGVIRNKKTNRILSQQTSNGYKNVKLSNDGSRKTFFVHVIVANTYLHHFITLHNTSIHGCPQC